MHGIRINLQNSKTAFSVQIDERALTIQMINQNNCNVVMQKTKKITASDANYGWNRSLWAQIIMKKKDRNHFDDRLHGHFSHLYVDSHRVSSKCPISNHLGT